MASDGSSLNVKDNRMFNADGSLREGAAEKTAAEPTSRDAGPKPPSSPPKTQAPGARHESAPEHPDYSAGQGIDFPTFILSLASSAQIALGLIPNPMTGEAETDLEHSRQTIDIIGMLEEKTRGNLDPEESGLLRQVLFQLRMQYVEISKELAKVEK